jgi:hypothetical protein
MTAMAGETAKERVTTVTVDQILTMVNIALGSTPLLNCEAADANHDSQVTVDEILTAVNNALNGCVESS